MAMGGGVAIDGKGAKEAARGLGLGGDLFQDLTREGILGEVFEDAMEVAQGFTGLLELDP
jgi:hypothetical protein